MKSTVSILSIRFSMDSGLWTHLDSLDCVFQFVLSKSFLDIGRDKNIFELKLVTRQRPFYSERKEKLFVTGND